MLHKIGLIEQILLRLNVLPHPLLDSIAAPVSARALQVGAELGVYDALSREPRSIQDIAKDVGAPSESLCVMLDCLVPLGYVSKSDALSYKLTSRGEKFLSRESPSSMLNVLLFSSMIFRHLGALDVCVRTGGPTDVSMESFSASEWATFTAAMYEIARTNAQEVSRLVPLKESDRSLLDMGGSHGLYAIECCQRQLLLHAEVMDYEPVREFADRTIASHAMTTRARFCTGDVLTDDLQGPHDVILAFNLIHGISADANASLAIKAFSSLRPGGRYVVMDQVKEAAGSSDLSRFVSSSLGLMLLNEAGGRTFSRDEIISWLERAGFSSLVTKRPRTPGYAIIWGTKASAR